TDLPRLVRRPAPDGSRPPGAAVGGHVHRLLLPRGRPGRRAGARGGRVRGADHGRSGVLRPDLDLYRPARRRPPAAAAQPAGSGPGAGRRGPGGRPRALVHGRAARRDHRAAAGRPARLPGQGRYPHAGRAADRHRQLGATRSRRRARGGPAALPPPRRDGLARRLRAAGPGRCRGRRGRRLLWPGRQLRCRARPLRRVGGRGRDRPAARRPRGRGRSRAGRRFLLPHPARPARRGQRYPPGPAAGQPPGGSACLITRLPGYLTAWTCLVWATSRSAASYTLVWAATVVRPRCTSTATARTAPPVTGRNMWLVEVIVAVILPSGSPRNVTSAPALSARDIRTPPWSTPAVVHRCGAQSSRATTRSAPASSRTRPSCPANGISATRASRSADMTGDHRRVPC